MLFRRGNESAKAFLPRDVSSSQQASNNSPASQMKSVAVMVILDSGFSILDSRYLILDEYRVSSIDNCIDYLLLNIYNLSAIDAELSVLNL